jgi:hypothetical protein
MDQLEQRRLRPADLNAVRDGRSPGGIAAVSKQRHGSKDFAGTHEADNEVSAFGPRLRGPYPAAEQDMAAIGRRSLGKEDYAPAERLQPAAICNFRKRLGTETAE